MDIFGAIEGLQSEKLASRILSLLLLRSQDLRDAFIGMVSDCSPRGPITMWSRFACVCEQPTENEIERGYVDIYIEVDDAVIGIENKFHAPFGGNQPGKYVETLQQKAAQLNTLVGANRKVEYLMVILVPRYRKDKEQERFKTKQCVVLSWEDALTVLEDLRAKLDSTTAVLLTSLREYVHSKVSFMPEFEKWAPHFLRNWEASGTTYQRALLSEVKQFFPEGGARLSCGEDWLGYYFATLLKVGKAWYGFVPAKAVTYGYSTDNQTVLIVACTFDVAGLSENFIPAEVPGILGKGVKCNSWVIKFDKHWNSPERWRRELQPFWQSTQELMLEQAHLI